MQSNKLAEDRTKKKSNLKFLKIVIQEIYNAVNDISQVSNSSV
jgi:hypothetical protein